MRTLSIILIILLSAPLLASPVDAWFVRTEPLRSTLASLPGEPLGAAPLTLRREAYGAVSLITGMESIEADCSLFADRARLASADPLADDARLVRELMRVYRSQGADPAARGAAALAVELLLKAARNAALVALSDAGSVADGASGKASPALASARRDYDRAMELCSISLNFGREI